MRRLLLVAVVLVAATTAPTASAAPTCDRDAAMERIDQNQGLVDAIRETGSLHARDDSVFDVFEIATLECHDLTGDGRSEMAVMLRCCTAASATPLVVFKPRGRQWHIAYRSINLLLDEIRRKGRRLLLSHPVYRRTDPLCCPSRMQTFVLRYADGRFQRRART